MKPAALRALALAAMSRLRSYSFTTTETLAGGKTGSTTTIVGRAVRPNSVTYTVTTAQGSTSVTTIGTQAYLKKGNGAWQHGRSPRAGDDPLAVLLAVLRTATPGPSEATHLRLQLTARAALDTHLINVLPTAPVTVVADLDRLHRVVRLTTTVKLHANKKQLTLTATTGYSGLDTQPPITAPR